MFKLLQCFVLSVFLLSCGVAKTQSEPEKFIENLNRAINNLKIISENNDAFDILDKVLENSISKYEAEKAFSKVDSQLGEIIKEVYGLKNVNNDFGIKEEVLSLLKSTKEAIKNDYANLIFKYIDFVKSSEKDYEVKRLSVFVEESNDILSKFIGILHEANQLDSNFIEFYKYHKITLPDRLQNIVDKNNQSTEFKEKNKITELDLKKISAQKHRFEFKEGVLYYNDIKVEQRGEITYYENIFGKDYIASKIYSRRKLKFNSLPLEIITHDDDFFRIIIKLNTEENDQEESELFYVIVEGVLVSKKLKDFEAIKKSVEAINNDKLLIQCFVDMFNTKTIQYTDLDKIKVKSIQLNEDNNGFSEIHFN